MNKYELYDGTKTYIAPNGEIDTKENMLRKFPGILQFKHVVLTDEAGEVSYGVMALSALCSQHGINQSLPVEEKISQLEAIANAPQPTYEESSEYQLKLREVEALEVANNIALSQMVLEVERGTITSAQFEAATGITVSAIETENIARVKQIGKTQ